MPQVRRTGRRKSAFGGNAASAHDKPCGCRAAVYCGDARRFPAIDPQGKTARIGSGNQALLMENARASCRRRFATSAACPRLLTGPVDRPRFWACVLCVILMLTSGMLRAGDASSDPWAPFERPWFDTLGLAQGLPHSITTAIAQDSRGIVWVGTMGGLVRYDGYRVQVFQNASAECSRVAGRLRASPAGVARRRIADRHQCRRTGPLRPVQQSLPCLSDRHEWDLGPEDLRVERRSSRRCLDRHRCRSGPPRSRHQQDPARRYRQGVVGNAISACCRIEPATSGWATITGLLVRRRDSNRFEHIAAADPAAGKILHDQIWSICEDRENRLWVGSVQSGAAWRGQQGNWRAVPALEGSRPAAELPTVRAILETSGGTMWMATDGRGIVEYVPGQARSRWISHDPAVPSSLPGDSVRALLQDRSLNLWAATDLGVARTDPVAGEAFSLLPSPLEMRALANTNVNGVFVDTRGRIWLGESGGHIDLIDLATGDMRHFQLSAGTVAWRDPGVCRNRRIHLGRQPGALPHRS